MGIDLSSNCLENTKTPVFLIINKIDLVHPDDLLKTIVSYKSEYDFAEIVPISAINGNNTERLLETLKNYLPEGPKYYPDDQVTDHPERFIISEFIREKVLHLTREEIPHSVAVVIEKIEREEKREMVNIMATIVVDRDSQKGIVIGKRGAFLKEIGTKARHDIEMLLGSKVFLELWVKVQKDWRNKPGQTERIWFRRRGILNKLPSKWLPFTMIQCRR